MKLKTILLAAAAAGALVPAARAADLSGPPPAAAVVTVPAYAWTGFYLGAHIGYGFSGSFTNNSGVSLGGASGILGGLQGGYDWQAGTFVVGIAADISAADVKRTVSIFGTPLTAKAQWLGSVRARAGFLATPDLLLYATGGFAFGGLRGTSAGFGVDASNTHVGWTVGAGAEYRFTPNVSALVEYRYTDFSRKDYPFLVSAGYQGHDVRLGLNYRFSTGPAAVVARY